MTALIIIGALLTVAHAVGSWLLWRRVRELKRYYTINFDGIATGQRALAGLHDRIAALESQALTFARHSDVLRAGSRLVDDVQAIRAELDAHRRGSRHRKVRP